MERQDNRYCVNVKNTHRKAKGFLLQSFDILNMR